MLYSRKMVVRYLSIACIAVAAIAAATDQAAAQSRFAKSSARRTKTVPRNRSTLYPEKTVQLHMSGTDGVIPPLVRGDREFDGNGPDVLIQVHYYAQGDSVYRRVFMQAWEESDLGKLTFDEDYTIARGWSPAKRVYKAPAGSRVVGVLGEFADGPVTLMNKVMSGHGSYVMQTLAGRVTAWGDRKGKDVGDYTRTAINFSHNLRVQISERPTNRVTVALPRTFTIQPPLVSGDAEFAGHGPHINVRASILNTGGSRLLFSMYMKAREGVGGFSNDFTTAEGTKTIELYRPPAGFRIVKVHGKTSFPTLVKTFDKSHKVEELDTELGRAHVFGDRKGKDAGVFTRVVFPNIKHSVVVELEPIQ